MKAGLVSSKEDRIGAYRAPRVTLLRMPSSPGRASRKRAPLWLVLLAIAAFAVWQYAHSSREATPPSVSVPPAAATVANRPPPEGPLDARRDLSVDEQRGGHTLARHVGRTDAELQERLARERGISAASTYSDRAAAESTVARALAQNATRVQSWLSRAGPHPNLALDYHGAGIVIGRSLARGQRTSVPCRDAIVVLKWTGGGDYYVLTSYPEARR